MKVLTLFRRDLRVTDHPALVQAARLGQVLPLYVADPTLWQLGGASARQWEFVAETLVELRAALAALGAPLVVRLGPEIEVISRLVKSQDIGHITLHAAPWRAAQDAALVAWARGQGLGIDLLPEGREALEPPSLAPVPGLEPGMIPHARALGLAADAAPHRQTGGRAAALGLAESYVAGRGAQHPAQGLSPTTGERSGSRLSAHLAVGALSAREVTALLPGRLPAPVPRLLANRLALRAAMLRAEPCPPCLPVAGGSHLAALLAGQTGLPFVDALLRYFRATGWLNAAGRGLIASVGVHHLGLDAAAVGQVLARLATDHHPALLARNLASVTTARVADPLRLGEDHDPQGQFIRRWLPELAALPEAHLHRPWRWTGAGQMLGRRYPEPLVDPAAALRRAREAAAERRRGQIEGDFEVIEGGPGRLGPRLRGPVQLALDL